MNPSDIYTFWRSTVLDNEHWVDNKTDAIYSFIIPAVCALRALIGVDPDCRRNGKVASGSQQTNRYRPPAHSYG